MVEVYHKKYLKSLATAIDLFWEGDEESALHCLNQGETELESAIGKIQSESFQNNLEGVLKKWRELLAKSEITKKTTIDSQAMDFFHELRPPDDSFQTSESDILMPDEMLPEDELQLVFSLYKDDKIFESIQLLARLKEKYQSSFSEFAIINEIESDYQDIRNIYESVQVRDGWTQDSSGDISVYYKILSGNKTYSLLSEGIVNAPLFNFLSIMYETDLYHTWLSFCKKSFTITNLSRTRKIIFQEYSIPLVATRHACIYGYGANLLLSDGAVVIISKSCDGSEYFKGVKLPENLKTKKAVLYIFGAIIRPISFEKIHVTLITNFDPVIKALPYKILNYFSKKLTKGVFTKAALLAKNLQGTVYQERMESPENKEFYDYLRETQQEYLNSLNK